MERYAGFEPEVIERDDEEGVAQLRAAPRASMFLMATLRRAQGAEIAVKVRNLSAGGLMAEVPAGLPRGEAIQIELRGVGLVGGRIAWAAGGRIGVAFDRAIDPMLARKSVVGQPQPQLMKAARTHWRPSVR